MFKHVTTHDIDLSFAALNGLDPSFQDISLFPSVHDEFSILFQRFFPPPFHPDRPIEPLYSLFSNVDEHFLHGVPLVKNLHASSSPPTHFAIFSERCSGNHFLRHAMWRNFNLKYSDASTHFFSDDSLDHIDLDRTLIICLVRQPLPWIDSFFKRLHHVPPHNKISIQAFIRNPFYSIFEEGTHIHSEILSDRHLFYNSRYLNIFQLRFIKLFWSIFRLPSRAKHLILLPYESLRDHYQLSLAFIQHAFSLHSSTLPFIPVTQYKGSYNYNFLPKPIVLKSSLHPFLRASNHPTSEFILLPLSHTASEEKN